MDEEERDNRKNQRPRKKPPRQKRNPIETAIRAWHEKHAASLGKKEKQQQHDVSDLTAQAPKRWTAYGPLVLLPVGSFTSAAWRDVAGAALDLSSSRTADGDDEDLKKSLGFLWRAILDEVSRATGQGLTHLAVNEGIPLRSRDGGLASGTETEMSANGIGAGENVLRSPSGLRILYGDFGPSTLLSSSSSSSTNESTAREQSAAVTEEDFARAFWVSTKQNGITQTWAPRWTMFSRGNVKEKARVLAFHEAHPTATDNSPSSPSSPPPFPHRRIPTNQRSNAVVVDLYAGIGYFAFCYAKLGFRVLCWELNPWSVEGLRRGAVANGWGVRVLRPSSDGNEGEEEEEEMLREVLAGNEKITVFLEDNARAAGRMRKLDALASEKEKGEKNIREGAQVVEVLRRENVMHVSCGLLPSSRASWETAWDITSESRLAWLHVHENVGVADIDAVKEEIRCWFGGRAEEEEEKEDLESETGVKRRRTEVCVEHVELVKTFAPGVWHCVFDLCVKRDMG